MATVNIGGSTGYIAASTLTGSSGDSNRTLVLSETDITATGMQVFINGAYAHYGLDYSFSGSTITFLNAVFDQQIISGTYVTGYSTSTDTDYCTPDEVWQELDGKDSDDISEDRVIDAIQAAEGLIDTKTETSFKAITVSDEVHTGDRYSLDVSPDQLDTVGDSGTRRDNMFGCYKNRVKTDFSPIVSITSLSVNGAGPASADSWTELTEQEGSSGDFYVEDARSGIIDFLTNYPRLGKRSWKTTYVYGYDRDSTVREVVMLFRVVNRLAILLSCQQILTTKSSGSVFDSSMDVKIGTIEIKSGAQSSRTYLESIKPQIQTLWEQLSELGIEVI